MQRALAHGLSPAPAVPLRFLLTAPWFAVLAALVLLLAGADAFASRWSASMLGATHLLTLGYLSMAMAGSMLQLIPVVTGAALKLPRAAAGMAWGALALGALLLSTALGLGLAGLFLPAALLLFTAFGLLVAPLARALARPAPAGAMPMVRGMRLALVGLVVAVMLGLALSAHLGGHAVLPVWALADLHAAWGLVGWVAMLVLGVAFQVIPMFQAAQAYPAPVTRWAPLLLAALLLGWSAASVLAPHAAHMAGMPVAADLAAFAVLSAWLLARRKRKEIDATTLYWRLSLASLAGAALVYLVVPSGEQRGMLAAVLFVGGFAMGAVNGMLYKIVPFLLWYHLQQDPRATRESVPTIRAMVPDGAARRQFWWHAAALAALLAAVFWPQWLARPGAALLVIASVLLALDLGRAARRCSLLQHSYPTLARRGSPPARG